MSVLLELLLCYLWLLLLYLLFDVGLARSEALRSPEGGALRAKRRARPTSRPRRRNPARHRLLQTLVL
jgi:hypothetical protein